MRRADETLGAKAHQVHAPGLLQRLQHQAVVLGVAILDQRPLHGLFVGVGGGVDLFHGAGVIAGAVHHGGDGRGRWIEILHLLGHIAQVAQIFGQLDGLLQRGAGVAAHQIGHQVLLLAQLLVDLPVFAHKAVIHAAVRLAHQLQHRVGDVLGRHLQLAGHMVFHQLTEEGFVLVAEQIVKADAAADKDLFHSGQGAELAQQGQIVAVIHLKIAAGIGEQALPVLARAVGQLLAAGGLAEVGRWAAHVVDITLEIRVGGHHPRLFQQRFVAARLDNPSLMKGQRAEAARAVAPAAGGQRKLDLLDGGHAAQRVIAGVPGTGIGQGIDLVHLLGGQGWLGRVLNDVSVAAGLGQRLGGEGVGVLILHAKAFGIGAAAHAHRFAGWQQGIVHALHQRPGPVDCAADKGDVMHRQAAVQRIGALDNALFAHAVKQQIGPGIHQNGGKHFVRPVVIVAQAAQAGLQPADEDGCVGIALTDQPAIGGHGIVRALAHHAAGGVIVHFAAALGHRVMADHRVHVAAHDQEAQPGRPEDGNGVGIVPVGLADDAHPVAVRLQHAADDRMAKAGVVDIGVADDIDKVTLIPAPLGHVSPGDGEKLRHSKAPFAPRHEAGRIASLLSVYQTLSPGATETCAGGRVEKFTAYSQRCRGFSS